MVFQPLIGIDYYLAETPVPDLHLVRGLLRKRRLLHDLLQ